MWKRRDRFERVHVKESEEGFMAKGTNQKLKLVYLIKILLEQMDEEHSITMQVAVRQFVRQVS